MNLADIPYFNPRPGEDNTNVLVYRQGDGYAVTCNAAPVTCLEFNDEELAVDTAVALGQEYAMPARRLRTYAERRWIDKIREWIDVPTWPSFR